MDSRMKKEQKGGQMDETSPKTGWQNLRVGKGYSVTVLFLFKELLVFQNLQLNERYTLSLKNVLLALTLCKLTKYQIWFQYFLENWIVRWGFLQQNKKSTFPLVILRYTIFLSHAAWQAISYNIKDMSSLFPFFHILKF